MNIQVTEQLDDFIKKRINDIIGSCRVVLFMKGNELYPSCGYSGLVVKILTDMGCEFKTFDVLEDFAIRQAIKIFADWPFIPQLYVDGEFIGGCDVIKDLYQTDELEKIIKLKS